MTGVILAGGTSERMGLEKASLLYGGETLLSRSVRKMRSVAPRTVVVSRSEVVKRLSNDIEVIEDLRPGRGPVAAILTALLVTQDDCAVIACDMPFFSTGLLLYMRDQLENNDAVVPHYGGLWEPLCAVYGWRGVDKIERWLEQERTCPGTRRRPIVSLLATLRLCEVDRDQLVRFGEPDHLFFNVNSPEDYARMLLEGSKEVQVGRRKCRPDAELNHVTHFDL